VGWKTSEKKRNAEPKLPEFYGFREDGSSYKSASPVDSACTRAVWRLVRTLQQRNLRPCEMVLEIAHEPDFVRHMFGLTELAQWSTLDRYWQWRLAWTTGSAMSTLKYRGAGVPLTFDDEQPWRERVSLAAKIHGEPEYGTYLRIGDKDYPLPEKLNVAELLTDLLHMPPAPKDPDELWQYRPLLTMSDDEMAAEKARQLAAFAAHQEHA